MKSNIVDIVIGFFIFLLNGFVLGVVLIHFFVPEQSTFQIVPVVTIALVVDFFLYHFWYLEESKFAFKVVALKIKLVDFFRH